MELPRYAMIDAYTLEELRHLYQMSDAKGRIRLLKKLYKGDQSPPSDVARPPFEIALLAVKDPHVEVRRWFARYGKFFDYSDNHAAGKNLEEYIKNDTDPFIRASLLENLGGNEFQFNKATTIERLAFVRRPGRGIQKLIEKIFDHEYTELGIDLKERKELILAFLTNKELLKELASDAMILDHDRRPVDGWEHFESINFFDKLWNFTLKWPKESNIQPIVFRCLPATDKTKSGIYSACGEISWKRAILDECDSRKDEETIKLGVKDPDGICRCIAYSKAPYIKSDVLEVILRSDDKDALLGLAYNKFLSGTDSEKVRERLQELGLDEWDSYMIEKKNKICSPKGIAFCESKGIIRRSVSEWRYP